MTKQNKNIETKKKVMLLRSKGLSYGLIAKEQDTNLNTVKSICRRNRNKDIQVPETTYCWYCGECVAQNPKRKMKKFCSDKCRYRWWQKNGIRESESGVHKIRCKHCGSEFQAYKSDQRKYCCHACYIAERFGKQSENNVK